MVSAQILHVYAVARGTAEGLGGVWGDGEGAGCDGLGMNEDNMKVDGMGWWQSVIDVVDQSWLKLG